MKGEIQDTEDRLEFDELLVRGFTAIGLVIWASAGVMSLISRQMEAFIGFAILALTTTGVLVLGWYYERIASAVLAVGAAALIVWGVVAGWEVGVWMMMGVLLIVPAMVAAAMFLFAEHEEEVIEHAAQPATSRTARA